MNFWALKHLFCTLKKQRGNRLKDSLGKFITLHKPRYIYLVGVYGCLGGLRVMFQVLMPDESGFNPNAGNIYFS